MDTVTKVSPTIPIVDPDTGLMTDQFRIFALQLGIYQLIIGTGPPEGSIEALPGQEYMDSNGASGAVKWIKQYSSLGGDKKQGWVAIG